MSISHTLKFKSQRTSEEVVSSLLSSNIGLRKAKYDQMLGEGVFGRVGMMDKFSQNNLAEEFRVEANLRLSFDQNSDEDVDEGLRIVGRAVALLLSGESGDAIFFYVSDTPILKRVNSKTTMINEDGFGWLRDALDEASLEYKCQSADLIGQAQTLSLA